MLLTNVHCQCIKYQKCEIIVNELNAIIHEKNELSWVCYSLSALTLPTERIANGKSTTWNNDDTQWKLADVKSFHSFADENDPRIELNCNPFHFRLLLGRTKSLAHVAFELNQN